ncbi:MAG TPA: TonB-dependent receptor [Thermoanaerobaculia bacterium]|nr:TonB-dependent receptor [Thermoanaerobaculia bacterium]
MWLAVAAAAAFGQRGDLSGRVLGPDDVPIPGASVVVRQEGGALERRVATDAAGAFRVLELPAGRYSLTVTRAGFAPRRLEGLGVAVGQSQILDLRLELEGLAETIDAVAEAPLTRSASSTVDRVIGSDVIERLPLNGRNFLELALLVPGNAPAANFDPTKSSSVLVSSAGQLGRGGMISIDGADNNDDMVGGPLQNVPQEAVQEFQIATNHYRAEHGRSASSVINVVTRSGTDVLRGAASFFFRDEELQGLPATHDPASPEPPFDRQHYALALGGPVRVGEAHWFAALEYRDQDGAVQVGERDPASRTIRSALATAPLEVLLGTARFDWTPSQADLVSFRYAAESTEDISASTLERARGAASQRQVSDNDYAAVLGSWTRVLGARGLNTLNASSNRFRNAIVPVEPGRQLTLPSLQDGTSFRVPQATDLDRLQLADSFSLLAGSHAVKVGAEVHWIDSRLGLGVFRDGRIEAIQDFPDFDRNGDGRIDDDDLLFAVTLRSAFPDRDLVIDDVDNEYTALFVQDEWLVAPELTLNLGLRWEMDSDVKNIRRYGELNPLVEPFLRGDRERDDDNFAPRLGFAWAPAGDRVVVRGGFGIFYDRVTLQLQTLERGLDGRALPIEVRAGNIFFLDPATGLLPPFAPTLSNPFSGFILPGAGASGIHIIDNALENPEVEQWSLGAETRLGRGHFLRLDGLYNRGSNFIIGRTIGEVFNPVVGGPDRVVNLESSVGTRYEALLLSLDKRAGRHRYLASYTLGRAENYANDDQIPFAAGPIDPDDLERERGPTPNDRRHRFTFAGSFELPFGLVASPLFSWSSEVPMDILMPDASTRVPVLPRNAGGRRFDTAAELNAFLSDLNAGGGVDGVLLPLVADDARFSDTFSSLDLRLSRTFRPGGRIGLTAMIEVFNLLDTTNILGTTNLNYSGFSNVLVRDSEDPTDPGYLRSSSFGRPVSTAGGVFGSGGPRAVQLGVRLDF